MDIKQKIKSAWNRLTGKTAKTNDSELGADEVVKKEVFPKTAKAKAKTPTAKKPAVDKNGCTRKPPSKRTRPTNNDYQMIDPDNDTADAGKS
ncbi:MAG: hypothetical protein K2O39_03915 [Clostridiales bacterium]|nr:hypothetical protein [Clostridiales bacterium]